MGYLAAGQCVSTAAAAANLQCSAWAASFPEGFTRCRNPSVSGVGGNVATFTLDRYLVSSSSWTTQTVALDLQACDDTQAPNFPWNLSVSEGAQISAAILGVWAFAWCFRALRRALNSDGNPESEKL